MKIGIMQPYIFPYIAYWSLMNHVDKYIIFDDVNYINRGWVDRNRILINGEVKYFNLPIIGKSQNRKINTLLVNQDQKTLEKAIRKVEFAYKKALFFDEVFPVFEEIMRFEDTRLHIFLKHSFDVIAAYLNINTQFIYSSELNISSKYKAQNRIIEICKTLGADTYVNPIGGRELYSKELFAENGLTLKFFRQSSVSYNQNIAEFQPNLSILDVMMHCPRKDISVFLNSFDLI